MLTVRLPSVLGIFSCREGILTLITFHEVNLFKYSLFFVKRVIHFVYQFVYKTIRLG